MNPPLDTNEATLASPRSVATLRNGEARQSCVVCRGEIVDNHWFCRLPESGNGESNPQNRKILLCSPRCALRHLATLYPHDSGFDSDYEQHQHTFSLLVNGEKPA